MSIPMGCSDGGSSSSSSGAETPSGPVAIESPVRMTSFDAATFLVADAGASTLSLVDKTTVETVASIRLKGEPTCVAYSDGLYFFGNRYNRSVDVLDADGNFLYYLGGRAVLFKQINDLAIDVTNGLVYALDTQAALIKVFNFDGSSAGPDIGEGLLEHPTALVIDPSSGNLLVSDYGFPSAPLIRIISPAGAQVDSIIGKIEGGNWFMPTLTLFFSTPQGLFVDVTGYLFFADNISGEIKVYNLQNNSLVKTLGSLGTGPDQLFSPLDVYVDEVTKDVFVADSQNGRITVFPGGGVIQ